LDAGKFLEPRRNLGQHRLLIRGADKLRDDLAGGLAATRGKRIQAIPSLGRNPNRGRVATDKGVVPT